MRAVVIHAAHDLRCEEVAATGDPGTGEVRVAIANGGICGSDLHYFHQGGFGAVRLREPMILGHEVSGRVVALGRGVAGLAPGDRVAVNPSRPCGACAYCAEGLHNQCLDMRFNGSAMRMPHEQGLFRAEVTVPAAQAVRLSPETDLTLAALSEPFAVCLAAVRKAGTLLGTRVLVSGCGPIGCLMVVAARLAGASEIIVTDLSGAPLAIAARLGATETIDLARQADRLVALADRKGRIDTVFECSGAAAALRTACEILRPRGQLVTVGLGADPALPLGLIVAKELKLAGSFRFDAEFAMAARMIDAGQVDLSPLVTDVFPVEEAVAAFERASDRAHAMKVQLDFASA